MVRSIAASPHQFPVVEKSPRQCCFLVCVFRLVKLVNRVQFPCRVATERSHPNRKRGTARPARGKLEELRYFDTSIPAFRFGNSRTALPHQLKLVQTCLCRHRYSPCLREVSRGGMWRTASRWADIVFIYLKLALSRGLYLFLSCSVPYELRPTHTPVPCYNPYRTLRQKKREVK